MKFSQRIGIRPIKTELEKEGISQELRNSLWTVILNLIINEKSNITPIYGNESELFLYFNALWIDFYKLPIDNLPQYSDRSVLEEKAFPIVRKWFFESDWDLVLDFIEFSSTYHPEFQKVCNRFFKREMSAYRFIDDKLVEINSKEEIIEIESALRNSDKFKSVKTHLKTAIDLLSDRRNPDYRNSTKESISAVEALSKIIINNEKATLGQALKEIEKKHNLPNSLKAAFSSLYGYTSDEGGIRHSLLENDVKIDFEEARFMLIVCSAFVNYLFQKI